MAEANTFNNPPAGRRGQSWSRCYVRWPIKSAVLGVVTFLVLFPYPDRFARHLSRVRNMQAMIAADHPRLAELERELRSRLAADKAEAPPAVADDDPHRWVQSEVERLVLERVAYAWDWDTWGCADYMPTVTEMFEVADSEKSGLREDCDGRAIIAASLMQRIGYDAQLATDLRHVWVVTPEGEWMGAGRDKTALSSESGNEFNWSSLPGNIPVALSYGIAVFPLPREIVILLTAYVLLLTRRTTGKAAALGLLLLVQGLLFMRLGFLAPMAVAREGSSWPAWAGAIHILAGMAVLVRSGTRRPHRHAL